MRGEGGMGGRWQGRKLWSRTHLHLWTVYRHSCPTSPEWYLADGFKLLFISLVEWMQVRERELL